MSEGGLSTSLFPDGFPDSTTPLSHQMEICTPHTLSHPSPPSPGVLLHFFAPAKALLIMSSNRCLVAGLGGAGRKLSANIEFSRSHS